MKIADTSSEMLEAIRWLAEDEREVKRIWLAPREAELIAIWERVTLNGLIPSTNFVWGGNSDWAEKIEE